MVVNNFLSHLYAYKFHCSSKQILPSRCRKLLPQQMIKYDQRKYLPGQRWNTWIPCFTNNKKRSHTQLDSRKQVIAFQDRVMTINKKGSSTPTKTRKTSNRQIQYNVENFDKIHASSASVRNWSSQ